MKIYTTYCTCGGFGLYIFLLNIIQMVNTQQTAVPIPIKHVRDYRVVNWCITGKDEPELHEFPFTQFTALLRRDRRYVINSKYRYRVEFNNIYSRMPINTEVICNTSLPEPWCIPIDCGFDYQYCTHPPNRKEFLKYIGRLFKTVHVIVHAEKRREPPEGIHEIWEPLPLEGIVLQASHNPKGFGLPTGQFFIEEDFICHDCNRSTWGRSIPCRKRSIVESVHPSVLVYHHLMTQINETHHNVLAGKQSQVHANFRWYSAPCSETRRLEFTLLAVRNFKQNKYDVVSLGPYEVYARGHSYHPESVPTPIFKGYFYHRLLQGTWCHATTSRDIQVVHPPIFRKFEMSPHFDECLREIDNPKKTEIGDIFTQIFQYTCYVPDQPNCPLQMIDTSEHAYNLEQTELPCSEICPEPIVPTVAHTTIKPIPIIKRHYHGGVLIMTNFCLMPINTFIARFYKETLNLENYKGVKVWFWWHLLGSMVSSVMIYFGTFQSGTPDQNSKPHVYLGQTYTLVLAICYFTAWGRHQKHWINLTTEFLHGCLGYLTILLAHISMHYSPGVGFVPILLVDLQIFLHCFFMLIMTGHICGLDSKFGMKPRRRHFPTVEACFDDIPIPKNAFRMILLGILATFTFSCSIMALFVQ